MLTQDHLALRLTRLSRGDAWTADRESLTFAFVRDGAGRLLAGSVARPLAPGDVLMLPAGVDATLDAGPGELTFWSFALRVEHLFPLFTGHELSLVQSVVDGLKHPNLYPASSGIAREAQRLLREIPPAFSLAHRSQLLRVASAILTVEFQRERSQPSGFVGTEEHLTQVLKHLSISDILVLSVDELAARFHCSRRHLNRLFHSHFDLSVGALRMEIRLLKAVSLLRDPGAKVIQVAEQCGFNHLGLFNTCFKRRFGLNPSQWRKSGSLSDRRLCNSASSGSDCHFRHLGLCPWCGREAKASAARPGRGPATRSAQPIGRFQSDPGHGIGVKFPHPSSHPSLQSSERR